MTRPASFAVPVFCAAPSRGCRGPLGGVGGNGGGGACAQARIGPVKIPTALQHVDTGLSDHDAVVAEFDIR
jgi:hypothetical protein